MKNCKISFSLILFIALSLFTSCFEKEDIQPGGNNSGLSENSTPAPLTFFEDAMVSKWSRYHAYDGSTRYYIFHADRTGCYWEQVGSSRRDKDNYVHWEIIDEGDNTFSVMVKGSPTRQLYSIGKYKYATDEILKGGSSILKYRGSNTNKECK